MLPWCNWNNTSGLHPEDVGVRIPLGAPNLNGNNMDSVASTSLISVPFTKEMKERIASIEPCFGFFENIQAMGGYVAGGFARFVLGHTSDIVANDVDIFCMGEDSFNKILDAFIYNPKNNLDGSMHTKQTIPYGEQNDELVSVKYGMSREYFPGETYCTGSTGVKYDSIKFQFIRRNNCSDPKNIIDDFDISVCCVYLDFKDKVVFFTKEFLEDEINRNLRLVHIKMNIPIHVILYRLHRYLEKGYKYHLSELIRIEEELKSHPNWTDMDSVFNPDVNITGQNSFHKEEDYKLLTGIRNIAALPGNMLCA